MNKTNSTTLATTIQAVQSWFATFERSHAAKPAPAETAKSAGLNRKNLALRSLVGHNLTINGDMSVDEFGLRIDGHIVGNVNSEHGLVMVGAGGSVLGTIRAARIIVAGKVVGNLIADDIIECNSTAQVQGHVRSTGFMIHSGATVRGTMAATNAKLPTVSAQAPANDDKHEQVQQRAAG